jgi:biotin operon repressor
MRSAKLDKSHRLQRVLSVLQDGRPHSTMEISRRANVLAVNSCIAELRDNGIAIESSCEKRIWWYRIRPNTTPIEAAPCRPGRG